MPTRTARAATTKRPAPRGAKRTASIGLKASDFEDYLCAAAAKIAPADVTELLAHAHTIEERLTGELASHKLLAQRGRVALHLLNDHAHGKLPQIPYHTISYLAAALFYFLDPMDVVPDFIPGVGTADDALVFDLAWVAAAAGVDRFLAAKGLRAGKATAAKPKAGRARTTTTASRRKS